MIKRIINLVLCFAILSMCIVPSCVFSDEVTGEYELGVMKALGIIDESVNAADTITRGNILDVMLKLANNTDSDSTVQIYKDVDSQSIYASNVYAATQMGIISGSTDGNFYPDLLVNSANAVKMLVYIMGYGKKAEATGGYPGGYLGVASSIGMEVTGGDNLTMGELSVMIYSILDAQTAEISLIGADGTVSFTPGKTLLENMDMQRYEGVFCANSVENIYGKSVPGEGRIVVGNKTILTEKAYDELFGCYVNAYTRNDNKDRASLLYMEAVDTNTIKAAYTDVVNSTSVISDNCALIQGEKDTKIKEYKLESDVCILYNGFVSDVFSDSIFNTDSGFITLIDNDENKKYDVVKIETGETIVSGGYSAISEVIMSKFGSGVNISKEFQADGFKVVDSSGNTLLPENIMEWDTVTAFYTKPVEYSDRKIARVQVSNDSFNGKIEYFGNDYIGIDGKEYKISPDFISGGQLIPLDNGMTATFMLNINGEVFAAKADMLADINKKTGILIGFDMGDGLNKSISVKIYDHADEMIVADVADRLDLDGKRVTKEECYQELSPRGKTTRQLIRYMLNSDGKLSFVDTATQGQNESDSSLELVHTTDQDSYKYFSGASSFGGIYNIDKDTLKFSQPKDITDDDSYLSSISLKDDGTYALDVYVTNNPFVAFAIVLNDAASSNLRESDLYLVTKVSNVIDESEEEVYKISVLGQSAVTEYYMPHEIYAENKVEAGDIICFATKNTTRINDVLIIYDLSEDKFFSDKNPHGGFAANQRVMMCSAYERQGSWVSLAFDDPSLVTDKRGLESRNVDKFRKYIWDTEENKARAATADDIVDYMSSQDSCTKMFISEASAWPKMCILYN